MANQVKNGGTFADDSAVGTETWSNPSNAQTSNDSYASASVLSVIAINTITHYLKVTNFGFTIPTGATINGVLARIERKADIDGSPDGAGAQDNIVKLVKGGTVSGNNKQVTNFYPDVDTYRSYGGSADLWGLTFTYTDINASNFGIVLSSKGITSGSGETVTITVDHIELTVYYTEAGTTYYQTVSGTLTDSGVVLKTPKTTKTGTVTSSAALNTVKTITKSITGALSKSAVLIKSTLKLLKSSYATTPTGSIWGANDISIGNTSWTGVGATAADDGSEASVILTPSGGG